jgi:hypothetical protein
MPYTIRKIPNKKCYRVSKKTNNLKHRRKTKKIFSKCTTLEKAKKQMRLLRALQYNKTFTSTSNRRI